MRRLSALLILILGLGACGTASSAALVTVDNEPVSRSEFFGYAQFLAELDQSYDLTSPGSISADSSRQLARQLIEGLSVYHVFQDIEGEDFLTQDHRDAAATLIEETKNESLGAFDAGQRAVGFTDEFVEFGPGSDGHELLIELVAMSVFRDENPDAQLQIRTELVLEKFQSAQVDAELGVWDPTTGSVLPRPDR